MPKFAAPEPIPDNPIAKQFLRCNGETIKIQNVIAINIHIKIGCNVNKNATPCPIKAVILTIYG